MIKPLALAFAVACGVACASAIAHRTAPLLEARSNLTQSEIEAAKESNALTLLGQFQMGTRDLVWLKTIEYLHNGAQFRMPTRREMEHGVSSYDSQGTAAGLEHKEGPTMIPLPEDDWRGVIGAVERHTEPWYPEHPRHSDPVELIPWYKLCLKVAPKAERLYSMGAFFLADFKQEPDEAYELLSAGVQAVPHSFEIHAGLGRLLFDYRKDYPQAATTLARAVELMKQEEDYYRKNRLTLDSYQEQLRHETYLYLAKSLTELGRFNEALAVLDEGYERTHHNLLRVQKRTTEARMRGDINS